MDLAQYIKDRKAELIKITNNFISDERQDEIYTRIDELEKLASQFEPLVSLKLVDILKVLDDEEYTVSVFSNDTVDDKISESIANTAVIDFKKQLKEKLVSKFSS